ncbi:MAG: PorT family protein [Chlorobi bacterium]|nr:PorT family protein [Chlorobiota bacterium]
MKKTLLILMVTLLLVPFASMAQIKIKPAFGINFASLNTDEYKMEGKTGYQIGGSIAFGTKFIVEPGIFWQKDNYEGEYTALSIGQEVVFDGDYSSLKIPLYFGYYLIGDSKSTLGIRVFGGPSAKFVISDDNNGLPDEFSDINDAIWGIKLGAGVDFSFMFAELGYNWGLNEVFDGVDNSQTNHFELTFGMKF